MTSKNAAKIYDQGRVVNSHNTYLVVEPKQDGAAFLNRKGHSDLIGVSVPDYQFEFSNYGRP